MTKKKFSLEKNATQTLQAWKNPQSRHDPSLKKCFRDFGKNVAKDEALLATLLKRVDHFMISPKRTGRMAADGHSEDLFPLSKHIETVLFHLLTRKHKVDDVLYRVIPCKIPEYWKIVKHDEVHDVFTIKRLATRTMLRTPKFVVYDWSRDVVLDEYKEMASFVLDASTSTLVDANQPVVICCG